MLDTYILSRPALLAATNVSAIALHNMIERGHAGVSEVENSGRGKRRLFSTADALRVACRRELSAACVPATLGQHLINYCVSVAREALLASDEAADQYISVQYIDGRLVFEPISGKNFVRDSFPVASIALPIGRICKITLRNVNIVIESSTTDWDYHHISPNGKVSLIGLSDAEMSEFMSMRARHMLQLQRVGESDATMLGAYTGLLEKHRSALLAMRNKTPDPSLEWQF